MRKITFILFLLILNFSLLAYSQEDASRIDFRDEDFQLTPPDSSVADSAVTLSPQKAKMDSVKYRGEQIEYDVKKNVLQLIGDAEITYQDMKLKADTVYYNSENRNIIAKGTPVIWDGDEKMVGDILIYNIDSRKGKVLSAYTKFENGFYKGDDMRMVGKNTLNVHKGHYTTCNLEEPHYHFLGDKMKVYVKDKVIIKPVKMYIGEIPVAYIPFWVFPIKPGRHSGLLMPIIGFESLFDEGSQRYFENLGYYWAINNYSDITFTTEYGETRGWKFYIDGRYKLRYMLNGNVKTRYERRPDRKDWDFRLNHSQTIDETTSLRANVHFLTSKKILTDSDEIDDRLENVIESNVYLSKRWDYASANLAFNERRDLLNETTTRTLPSLSLTFQQFPVIPLGDEDDWWRDIRGRFSSSFKNYTKKQLDAEDIEEKTITHTLGASYNMNLSVINFTPSISYKETWKDDRDPGKIITMSFGQLSANTNIYGIFNPNWGRLKSIRHTITPKVSYNIFPSYTYSAQGPILPLINWDHKLEDMNRSKNMPISLKNVFEAKIAQPQRKPSDADSVKSEDGKEEKIELFRLNFSTSYDFDAEVKPIGNLSTSFRATPIKKLSLDLSTVHEVYDWEMLRLNFSTGYSFSGNIGELDSTFLWIDDNEEDVEKTGFAGRTTWDDAHFDRGEKDETRGVGKRSWSLSADYHYSRGKEKSSAVSSIKLAAKIQPTKNWNLSYNTYYDIEEKRITRQSYNITRNIHCWEATLNWQRYGDYWNYYLIFRVKDLPDLKIEHQERSD